MKNPLRKRILRELKDDMGKYLVIFLFLIMLISLLSGFIVATDSMEKSYYDGFTTYNTEDGHMVFNDYIPEDLIKILEEKADITLTLQEYCDENYTDNSEKKIRIFYDRDTVNKPCVIKGDLPVKSSEIALDRMYADNNELTVGDSINIKGKELVISGLIATPEYSCLYENNSDMMFDALNFGTGLMTKEGYESLGSSHKVCNYAWKYPEFIYIWDEKVAAERSDKLMNVLREEITAYDIENMQMYNVTDYLPRYLNKAVTFTGEDMGGDKVMLIIFGYIVIFVIAFVFAITTSNSIEKEAATIGTLRATGYTRAELIRHYMILPVLVTVIASIVGNILGYTYMKNAMANLYLGSYSLAKYVTVWSADAFIRTTVVPFVIMILVNFFVLYNKLKLSPLRFLRRDLSKKGKKKAFKLNTKIPILTRFRLRIIFQNIPGYITLFFGVFIGGVLVVFGLMFAPLLDDMAKLIKDNRLCDYQYVLKNPVETANSNAEKIAMTGLDTTDDRYLIEEITIYGITPDSKYIETDIPKGQVVITNGMEEKYGLSVGDVFVLQDDITEEKYEFTVGGTIEYEAALSVFLNIDEFNKTFNLEEGYFNGYFSNEELTDIAENDIYTVITVADLTKTSDQLTVSMGNMLEYMTAFGVIMFVLLMYILSKQIIEKNSQSISMTKILGFSDGEIGRLYIISTSIVVVASLLITIPLISMTLKVIFEKYLYKSVTGYIPYIISNSCYVKMFIYGVVSYAVIAILQLRKIRKIPKSDALKNVE